MMQDVIVQNKAHGNIRRTQNGKSRGAVVAGCDFSFTMIFASGSMSHRKNLRIFYH